MQKCYIAGPMTGLPNYNYPAFHAAAAKLRAMGYLVENPAENAKQNSWAAYMRLAVSQMLGCDFVVMLPSWQKSRGATIEYNLASDLGLMILMLDEVQIAASPAKRNRLSPIEAMLPVWKCHKQVRAAKIINIELPVHGAPVLHVIYSTPGEESYSMIPVTAEFIAKHRPHTGGYFVIYDDGYQSFSPAKAFEDGYTLIPYLNPPERYIGGGVDIDAAHKKVG
jgi:hypothetical protein